jgi:hypothetical protein
MCLLLLLFWCSAVMGRSGALNLAADNSRNSRFGEFHSRLGGLEFPFRAATGIGRNCLIWLAVFAAKRRFGGEIGEISRYDGKNREPCPN